MRFQHFRVEKFLWLVFTSEKNAIKVKKVSFLFWASETRERKTNCISGITVEFKNFSRENTKIRALIAATDPKNTTFQAKTANHFGLKFSLTSLLWTIRDKNNR